MSVRPFPDSSLFAFGQEFVHQSWDFLNTYTDTTDMVKMFEETMSCLIEKFFPLKRVTLSEFDKPYFNEELRVLRRQRQRIYNKSGKSDKYMRIKNLFDKKLLAEKIKYRDKICREVKEGKRGSSYSALKKMSLRCDQQVNREFILPEHQNLNLSPLESAEKIVEYFSQISREYSPLSVNCLPDKIRQYIC